ncbi:MAG: hypothetical protein GXY06_05480 [Clostridiaceae bacterium]|nr:hypothetical protein [Clostridiaceae bacterium]
MEKKIPAKRSNLGGFAGKLGCAGARLGKKIPAKRKNPGGYAGKLGCVGARLEKKIPAKRNNLGGFAGISVSRNVSRCGIPLTLPHTTRLAEFVLNM